MESLINSNLFKRPNYAYGLWRASCEAQMLGFDQITAIEFGVASGNGLLALEHVAEVIKNQMNIAVNIYGFDTGEGMPEPIDFRDLPHIWQPGFFKMDIDLLMERIKSAKLVIANVKDTLVNFKISPEAPIGFISFDLDFYSSTMSAFEIFKKNSDMRLPRVFLWMDDTIGDHWETHSKFAGELLAIEEYNSNNEYKKIAKINCLNAKLHNNPWWSDGIYVHHEFTHSHYNTHVYPKKDWQLPLEE